MGKLKNWVRKQDFIELTKKINYLGIPLFIIGLFIMLWAVYNLSMLSVMGILLIYIIITAVLYVIPILIHQQKK